MPRTGLFVADAEVAYPASDYDPIGHLPFAEIAHPVCIDGESAFYDAEGLLDWMRRSHYGESPTTRRPIGVNEVYLCDSGAQFLADAHPKPLLDHGPAARGISQIQALAPCAA